MSKGVLHIFEQIGLKFELGQVCRVTDNNKDRVFIKRENKSFVKGMHIPHCLLCQCVKLNLMFTTDIKISVFVQL